MKRALVILLLLLTGCVGPTSGRGSRLLPWNWFSPDRAGQLERAQGRTDGAEQRLVDEAHRDLGKTVETLGQDPAPTKYTLQALRFGRHGLGLLDQVKAVPFADQQADAQLVRDLLSENADVRLAAIRRQADDDARATGLAKDLEAARAKEAALTTQLQESDRRYQEQAEKYRRVIFWVAVIGGGWLVLQLLAGAARFYPGLAPVARIAGMVSAPVIQAQYNRLSSGIGQALASAGAAAEMLRPHLDTHTDVADQQAIASSFNSSPKP